MLRLSRNFNFNFIISQIGYMLRLLVSSHYFPSKLVYVACYKVPPSLLCLPFFFSFLSDNFCMLVLYRFQQHGTLPVSEVIGGIGARSKKSSFSEVFAVFQNRDWLYQSKWDPNCWSSCRQLDQIRPDHRGALNVRVHYQYSKCTNKREL